MLSEAPNGALCAGSRFLVIACNPISRRRLILGVGNPGQLGPARLVRMRMVDCMPAHHGFMTVMSGSAPVQAAAEVCPEYTLVSDKVVFVIVGKSSNQLIPLADVVDFRFDKNKLGMRIDDARHESKFNIKEMILRSDWERIQKHIKDEIANPSRDTNVAVRTRE